MNENEEVVLTKQDGENIGEAVNETSQVDPTPEVKIEIPEQEHGEDIITENEPVTNTETLNDKHAREEVERKQKELKEAEETKSAAKKIEADPSIRFTHPLMNCEMNLMEISHRVVEKIEKAKYRIVGKSEGDYEADKKQFAEILINELIKFN